MGAKNRVIAGDYKDKGLMVSLGKPYIVETIRNPYPLDSTTIESYEVVEETSRKSASSAVTRAAIGNFIVPGAGLMAGLSAKSKAIHQVAIYFKNGKKSLIEIDDKIYNALIQSCF